MIVTKTYITKNNTIVKDNFANLSLNPVLELNYGKTISRGLIYFDHTRIQKLVEDKTYPDMSKLHHVLKMTNCASITNKNINSPCLESTYEDLKDRAVSFDVILFLIPNDWDNGRGFDYVYDLYNKEHKGLSVDGSNWYQFKNYQKWCNEGVYTTNRLFKEYDLFTSKNGNISNVIVAKQHFDYGNENLSIDITDIVNKFIVNEMPNYGLGIAFAPYYENIEACRTQYVGFFTQHTHTFYEPYVETTYDEYIKDDRNNFYLDKNNKLYFYASINGRRRNLDIIPTCSINGTNYAVKQATKGVYYVDVSLNSDIVEDEVMMYDIWDNIIYQGKHFPSVELNFITKKSTDYFSFGLPNNENKQQSDLIPTIYGISGNESIKRGDIRKVIVDCRIPYTTNQQYVVDNLYYRLYTKEGTREIDVIDWMNVEQEYLENCFYINTNDLIPFRYYIDIKVCVDNEIKIYHEMLKFDIVDDITDKFN